MAVDLCGRAVPGNVQEAGGTQDRYSVLVGAPDDGLGQWMLGLALDRHGQREQPGGVLSVDKHIGDLRLTLGEGAGLVHYHRVDPGSSLQRGGVLEQHTALGAQPAADHDRGRCGQAKGVGAGDHHDGDGEQQRLGGGTSDSQPGQEGRRSGDQRDQYKPERGPVGEPLSGCLGVLCLPDQRDDLRERGLGADLGRPYPQRAGGVDGGADHLVAGRLVYRQALAGDHRLVDLAVAVLDHAVHRDLGAGSDQKQITDRDVGGGDLDRLAVADDDRHRRRQVEQRADGVVGATSGPHLEPVPEQHERGQHGGRLVEHLTATGQRDAQRIQPARADRHRDQHHHVECAGAQGPPRAVEEDPRRVEDDRQAEQQSEHIVA